MRVLGINAVFHDPSAALVVDGGVLASLDVAAAAADVLVAQWGVRPERPLR